MGYMRDTCLNHSEPTGWSLESPPATLTVTSRYLTSLSPEDDQGYTGDDPEADAASYGIHLEVVSLPEAKKGFVILPQRWVVERSNGWMARFRRSARDYERLSETLNALHHVAFSILMLQKAAPIFSGVHNTL